MFKSTSNKGFQMTFENGWTISVQFGYGNYCDNRCHPGGWHFEKKQEVTQSPNAEIAIWNDKSPDFYNFGSDTVKGYCSANEVAEWIDKVKQW